MRFLLDEGLPFRLVAFLQAQGHDVTIVGADYPQALPDQAILTIALDEQRTIITNDKDFGELVFRERLPHAVVILFRVGYLPIARRIALLQRVLHEHRTELDRFIVVTRRRIRVRSS